MEHIQAIKKALRLLEGYINEAPDPWYAEDKIILIKAIRALDILEDEFE